MLATCQIVICISLLTLVVVPTLEHTYVEFARCIRRLFNTQSSLNIFTQKYLHKCKDTYFILQNKYLHIYEDSFGAKLL